MGSLERESRKRTRANHLQKIILATVATAGMLSVMALAPNALQALGMLGLGKKKRQKEIITNSRKRMVAYNLLEYTKEGFLRLTKKGEAKLRQLELHDYKFKKPKRWDKKWRLLIFDIQEERRLLRDKVRRTLRTIGFERLQDSVWIYPYDCEDLITLLKADFQIGKDVLYIIADKIENDGWLKERFDLY
ncbi:MAG: hypothetical protein Q7R65_02905 [bacterium]|nr:hypothetical protein [bacterium]